MSQDHCYLVTGPHSPQNIYTQARAKGLPRASQVIAEYRRRAEACSNDNQYLQEANERLKQRLSRVIRLNGAIRKKLSPIAEQIKSMEQSCGNEPSARILRQQLSNIYSSICECLEPMLVTV